MREARGGIAAVGELRRRCLLAVARYLFDVLTAPFWDRDFHLLENICLVNIDWKGSR